MQPGKDIFRRSPERVAVAFEQAHTQKRWRHPEPDTPAVLLEMPGHGHVVKHFVLDRIDASQRVEVARPNHDECAGRQCVGGAGIFDVRSRQDATPPMSAGRMACSQTLTKSIEGKRLSKSRRRSSISRRAVANAQPADNKCRRP